jgi:hypothetical protein
MQHNNADRQPLVFLLGCGVTVSTGRFERSGLSSILSSPAGVWCSGNTRGSDSLALGSIPSTPSTSGM